MDPQYEIDAPEEIFSPGLVVFRDLVVQNIERVIAMAGGVERLRPHCKTHKMAAVTQKDTSAYFSTNARVLPMLGPTML